MPGSLELDQLDAQMPYWLGPARPPEPRELSPRPRRARGRTSLGLGTHAALRSSPVARRNKTGAAPTPCGKARCGPGNLPRRTAFDVSARSPRAREATMASPAAPDDPDLLAQLRGRRRRAVKADEQGGGSSRPGPPLEPGRSAASPLLSPRESPRLPVPSTPEAQAQVEFPPCIGLTQGPSDPNEQCLRPDASDNAMRRPQGLHQVVNQGWVAYFYCHCRCHAPRVAAGEARTSHSRQKRSAVKAAASEG
jgi:hypothetical protein